MVFKFLKKIFAGDGDKSDSEKDGTVAGSSQQKDPHVAKREAAILEALSGNFGNHVDAETTLIRNLEKWKHLLQSFADSCSENRSKEQVFDKLKKELSKSEFTKTKPLLVLKESSDVIDDQFVATVLEFGDILLFNGTGTSPAASRKAAIEAAYNFFIDFRDMISNFKKAFYFSHYDQKAIVETLAASNTRMFQLVSTDGNISSPFTCSITITNMAYFNETATSAEAALRAVAHEACEYLRKLAGIGNAQMMNIFTVGSKNVTIAQNNIIQGIVGNPTCQNSGTNNNNSNTGNAVISASSSKVHQVKMTSSLLDESLIDKWTLLMENFSLVCSVKQKSKWHIRKELEEKNSGIFVRSFKETIKEDGKDVVIFWGIAEVKDLFKLKEKGKDEHDCKDNALGAVVRFLNHMVLLLKDFKRQYSPSKFTSSVFEFLQKKYPTLIQVEQKSTKRAKQPFVSVELLNVASFKAMVGDEGEAAAMEAASKGLLDLLLKISKWKERVNVGNNNNNKPAAPQATNAVKKSDNVNNSKQVQLPKPEMTAQKAKLPLLQTPKTEVVKVVQQPDCQQQTDNKQLPAQKSKPLQQIKHNQQPALLPLPSSSSQVLKDTKASVDTKKQTLNGGGAKSKSGQPVYFKGKASKSAQAKNAKKAFYNKKQKNGSTTTLSTIGDNKKSKTEKNISKQAKHSQSSTVFKAASPLSSTFGSQDELRESRSMKSTKMPETTVKLDEETEARMLIPEIVKLIAWYNSAIAEKEVSASEEANSSEKSSSPTSEQEKSSPEWTILYAMQSAGMEFDDNWDFDEENKLFTFTLAIGSHSKPFTFAVSSPEQEGEVGTDYIPSCCNEVAKIAVKWFAEMHDLLFNFNRLHSAGEALSLSSPSSLIKSLKKSLGNKNQLRWSVPSKVGDGNNKFYTRNITIDRVATFVGVGASPELAELAVSKKVVDYLLELLKTDVQADVVDEE